jgi:hypothetical protein
MVYGFEVPFHIAKGGQYEIEKRSGGDDRPGSNNHVGAKHSALHPGCEHAGPDERSENV